MKPIARVAAAIEILEQILNRHRPTSEALSDWGKANRFAGSGDRNAIGGLVYDALRRRSSLAWAMGEDTPRALALAAAPRALAMPVEEIVAAADGSKHAPAPLTAREQTGLTGDRSQAPPHVQADVPDWLWPSFEAAFDGGAIAEGVALAQRAPADLRVNALKATPEKVAKSLSAFAPEPMAYAPLGLRIPPPQGPARTPNLEAEAAFQAGWFEIQDQGSQIAARLAGAGPRQQVLDLCAGGGGKTLAMAAEMQNTGQIYAYDEDRHRLKPIFARLKRAGVRNAQVLRAGDRLGLAAIGDRFDVVLVDAPCTGTGVWRRKPDAKWRLKAPSIEARQREQTDVLDMARALVKPGGRLVYVTCSLLPEENTLQVERLLARAPELSAVPYAEAWCTNFEVPPPASADGRTDSLLLTPARHGTDGFFVAVMRRAG